MTEKLTILYQDDWLVAIDKPAGLLVHRSMLDRHETRFAVQLLRDQLGRRVYPLHRLDKPTSGVLLFCFAKETAQLLGAAFREHRVEKRYLAVVRGWPAEEGEIDYPLTDGPERGDAERQRDSAQRRPALTRYRTLARVELPFAVGRYPQSRYALVEACPTTGRRHQLRRHFKHLFHPIIGDTNYGEGRHNRLFREQFACQRLLLHAIQLRFTHPFTQRQVAIDAPLPEDFRAPLLQAGFWPAED